ncbi:MAG: 30S ribosomal protein S12 methylthiotransferase RimO [Gemmatimonadota bacterium]
MKLGLVSLGCDKNTVDSERILSVLAQHGAEHTQDLGAADLVLVNTCGFIDAAKEESIETLLDMSRLKRDGRCQALVAVGCLVEQYRQELEPALPEVDLFVGLRDMDRLIPELRGRGLLGDPDPTHPGDRTPLGDLQHVRYLKVSEGCSHGCAFCAIPLWRGRHRSFEVDQLVAEAQRLEAQGAVELNLVAQDLAHFGRDLSPRTNITELLRRLLGETTIPWFRLLYIYSAGVREELIRLVGAEERILPYLDMPIQHASDPVLERMRRPERRESLLNKFRMLRNAIPNLTLRTTVMVGFPGETDADFRALLDFMEEVEFDRLGAFAFSPQERTAAADMEDLYVPFDVGQERLAELLEVQRAISADSLDREIGGIRQVLVKTAGPAPTGRTAGQADDVDGITRLQGKVGVTPGSIVEVRVTAADDFDLEADVLREIRPAPATHRQLRRQPAERPGRALPVVSIGLEGAWGK